MGRFLMLFLFSSGLNPWAFANSGITYHGRLLKPDGTPVTAANVQFRLQIRTPGVEDCLLFEELQSANLSGSNGVFSVSMNDGNGLRQDANAWGLFDALSNRRSFSFSPGDCTGVNNFTPVATDNRKFRVLFNDGTFAGWEALPNQFINYIPMSIESYAVGGFNARSLVRVETAGALGNIAPLTDTQYAEILALVGGTTTQYGRPTHLNGSALPAIGSGQSVRWSGSAWEAYTPPTNASLPTCTAGQVLFSNGSALSCVTDGGSASIDGDDITSGTIGGTTAWNTSGNISTTGSINATGAITGGSLSGSRVSTRDLRIYESTNTNYVSIAAPAGLSPNYVLTLPGDDGGIGQVLSTDGSGVLSWITPATGNVNLSHIRSTINPLNPVFPSAACATSETLRYDLMTDTYGCSAISGIGGIFLAGPGTQAAPSISFNADNNTGFYNPYDGAVSLSTNNSTIFTFDLNGMAGSGVFIRPGVATYEPNPAYSFIGDDDNGMYRPATNSLGFVTNGTEKLRIQPTGEVGIGTKTPARLLHVNGPMRLAASALPTGATGDIAIDSGDGNKLKWYNGSGWVTAGGSGGTGDFMADGSVAMTGGIQAMAGNDSPDLALTFGHIGTGFHASGWSGEELALDVNGSDAYNFGAESFTSYRTLRVRNGDATKPEYGFDASQNMGMYLINTNILGFSTASTERMRINASGNVGIGTASPSTRLHVHGSITNSNMPSSGTATTLCYGAGGLLGTCTSLQKYKTNVQDLNLGLDLIEKLRPVSFDWKATGENDLGFIAEEVESIDRRVASYLDGELRGVGYNQITAVLVKAVQELREMFKAESEEVRALKSELALIKEWTCKKDPDAPFCKPHE